MSKVTVREYAGHRGVTERQVRRYLADGMIPPAALSKKGRFILIDTERADRILDKAVMSSKIVSPRTPQPQVMAQVAKKGGTSGLDFTEARKLKERYRAALLKIELDEKTGRLVDAEQVKVAAFGKARAVRDALLNVSDRIGPILAAESDQTKVSDILTKEIRTALEELSK